MARRLSPRQRGKISRENQQEYDNEKRAKELSRRGFNEEAIGGMMMIPERHARKMVKHRTDDIILDGKL